jgi:hypothetical protein
LHVYIYMPMWCPFNDTLILPNCVL